MTSFYLNIPAVVILVLFTLSANGVFAQENQEELGPKNKIALLSGYTWVPQGRNAETEKKEFILVPNFGLAYEYWFNEKWAIGTYNELEIINISVEQDENQYIDRENVMTFTLGATYRILEIWTVTAGIGVETDKNETLRVGHFGTECIILEKGNTELSVELTYTSKDIYDAVTIGLVLGKKF